MIQVSVETPPIARGLSPIATAAVDDCLLDSKYLKYGRINTMFGNTFGKLFCVTNFGESHGPAIGCVIDGCPPGMALSVDDIQADLDRRKPGTSRHVT